MWGHIVCMVISSMLWHQRMYYYIWFCKKEIGCLFILLKFLWDFLSLVWVLAVRGCLWGLRVGGCLWVGLSLCVILKRALQELEAPRWLLHAFKGKHLEWPGQAGRHLSPSSKGESLGSNMVGWLVGWLKISVSPICPHYDWVNYMSYGAWEIKC